MICNLSLNSTSPVNTMSIAVFELASVESAGSKVGRSCTGKGQAKICLLAGALVDCVVVVPLVPPLLPQAARASMSKQENRDKNPVIRLPVERIGEPPFI